MFFLVHSKWIMKGMESQNVLYTHAAQSECASEKYKKIKEWMSESETGYRKSKFIQRTVNVNITGTHISFYFQLQFYLFVASFKGQVIQVTTTSHAISPLPSLPSLELKSYKFTTFIYWGVIYLISLTICPFNFARVTRRRSLVFFILSVSL